MSALAKVLMPLPNTDFDPTECAVPWQRLSAAGVSVDFATPAGGPATADPRMVDGRGLGVLAPFLTADGRGRAAYAALTAAGGLAATRRYDDFDTGEYDGLLLAGGHAAGMKPYLESTTLQVRVGEFFAAGKPVAAICHGVLAAARARNAEGRSVLDGRRTTALPSWMELSAWRLTRSRLGDYYRTYPTTVQDEVTAALGEDGEFVTGPHWSPRGFLRDRPGLTLLGFTVRDGNYLSARWPGDAHRFADEFIQMLRS